MNKPLFIILIYLLGSLTGVMINPFKSKVQRQNELIQKYTEYKNHCEELLDSMSIWDEYFVDVVVETDTYQFYSDSRERLDSCLCK